MNRKGQNFIVELFAMLMIFAIIITIISVNSLSGGKLIKFAQVGYEAFSQDEVLLLFHESVEIVSFTNSIHHTEISSEALGCIDCNRMYPKLAYITNVSMKSRPMLSMDYYNSDATYRIGIIRRNYVEYHDIISGEDVLDVTQIETGLFYPTIYQSRFFGFAGTNEGGINSIILILDYSDDDNFGRAVYDGAVFRNTDWRIKARPLEEQDVGETVE